MFSKSSAVRTAAFFLAFISSTNDFVKGQDTADFNSHEPIQGLELVYNNEDCPFGKEPLLGHRVGDLEVQLPADLNAGTNGYPVKLCFQRGGSESEAVQDITFVANATSIPDCPPEWWPVQDNGGSFSDGSYKADFNRGASRTPFFFNHIKRYIVMCYRTVGDTPVVGKANDPKSPIYQLRLLDGSSNQEFRHFEILSQNLNEAVGGEEQYLAFSRSPSHLAAAIAFAGMGEGPMHTLDWLSAVERENSRQIDVNVRIDCEKHNWFEGLLGCDVRPSDGLLADLCGLFILGIEEYWSGPVTLAGVTKTVNVIAEDTDDSPNIDITICQGEERSGNLEPVLGDLLSVLLYYSEETTIDSINWRYLGGHEIGHSILDAAHGITHSITHKGSSTYELEQHPAPEAPNCTLFGDIDLMKYHTVYCSRDRMDTTNWDRAKLLMTAGSYTYDAGGAE